MTRRHIPRVLAGCAAALLMAPPLQSHRFRKDRLYALASRFLGYRLGALTTRRPERIVGRGRVVISGHPDSGRRWTLPRRGYLSTDGFTPDTSGTTEIIDTIDLGAPGGTVASTFPPKVRRLVGPLGCLMWQEPKPDVYAYLRSLRGRSPRARIAKGAGSIVVHFTAAKLGKSTPFDMRLQFHLGRLATISWREK